MKWTHPHIQVVQRLNKNKHSFLRRQFKLDGEISYMFHLQQFKLEIIQFDEHIFQMGRFNHQLVKVVRFFLQ